MIFQDAVYGIYYTILSFFWFIFISIPFKFLSLLTDIFNFLSFPLINLLFFGKASEELRYSEIKTPIIFNAFLIINSIFFLFIILLTIIRWSFSQKNEKNLSLINMLQKMIPALILIFGIPLLSFVVINIFNTFFNIFTISINNNQNISHNIFLSLKPQEIDLKTWKDLTIDNSFGIIPFEEYAKINISSSELLFFPSIVGITLLSIFIKNAIYLSNKTFQYFFLFLISPFVFSTMLFDGGKRFNNWNKMYFSKLISIFVYILGLKIFSFYSVIINNSINGIDNIYNFTKLSLFSILLIGGAYSISKFVKMISNLLGESHTFRSTLIENKLIYENIKEIMSQNFYSNYINKKNCVIQSLKEKNITFSKISDKELKSKNLFQTINFDNNKEFAHKRSDYAST